MTRSTPVPPTQQRRRPFVGTLQALEQRIMFDGAAVATAHALSKAPSA